MAPVLHNNKCANVESNVQNMSTQCDWVSSVTWQMEQMLFDYLAFERKLKVICL